MWEGAHHLVAAVHLRHEFLEHLDQVLDDDGAHPRAVAVRHGLEGLPVLAPLAVEDVEPHVGIEGGGCGGQAGGVGLAHAGDRPDQQARRHQHDVQGPPAGIQAEGEALPEVERLQGGEGGDRRLLGVGVLVGHPQRHPPGRAVPAAVA